MHLTCLLEKYILFCLKKSVVCASFSAAVKYSATQFSTIRYSATQFSSVQFSTIRYNFSTVQHSSVQFSTHPTTSIASPKLTRMRTGTLPLLFLPLAVFPRSGNTEQM